MTWTDSSGLDGSGQGIVAQVFNPDGTPNGAEFVVNNLTSSTQNHAEVAVLEDDSFIVTWESVNSGGAGDGDGNGILARHFNSDGTPKAAQFVVNTEITSTQSDPAVTPLNDGGFLITWESFSSGGTADGDRFGVFAQRFDAGADPVGTEFQINTSTRGDQFDPQVAVLANGNLAVTWTDDNSDLSVSGVFAAIYAPDGTPVTEEFRVNDQRINSQFEPDIAALDTGGFVIAWTDNNSTDGSGQGVFAQQYDAGGNRLDSQFQVNTTTAGSQNQPAVEGLPGGGFVVGWNGSVLIQIYGNEAPTISPVSAEGDEDTAIILDAAIFDAGFTDPDGNTLQEIRIETFPNDGVLELSGSPVLAGQVISRADLLAGNLIYTGNQDFNGADDFLWTGSDGIAFSSDPPVAANITVNPVNDAPGLEAGPDTSVGEGVALNRQLTLSDPDIDNRSFTIDFGDGSAVQNFNSTSLTPNIAHSFGAEGTFTVTVTVDDNAGEANSVETDTFTVTVTNSDPNAANDSATVSEDGPAASGNVLTNDSDPGNDPLTVGQVDGQAANVGTQITLTSGALFTLNSDGTFDYDPNGQFENLAAFQSGSDQVTYQVSDGEGGLDTATLFVTVNGRNDDPIAQDDAFNANDDATISGNVLDDNGSGADSDIDNSSTLTVTALNGQAGDVGNQITLGSGALLTLNSDGTFDYDPNGAFTGGGTETFTYTLEDDQGATDTATATITLNATNQPPVAQDDTISTDEETLITGNVLADNGNGADSDPDADPLTVTQINGVTADIGNPVTLTGGGTVTLQGNGDFSFDPNGQYEDLGVGESATETFTYTIQDGQGGSDTATATITINGVNDAPVASSDNDTTDEDSTTTGNVLTNDNDIDGDTLIVSEVAGSALAVGVATATIGGGSITLNSDGSYSYDPGTAFNLLAQGDAATDSIQYTVDDGQGGSDTATLFITVSGVNDGPAAQDDAVTASEDSILNGDLIADNGSGPDSDPDQGDIPFISEVNGVAANIGSQITLGSGALLVVNGSGTFSYDPNGQFEMLNSGETATDSFAYTLQDSEGATDTATVTVTINGNADMPVAMDDTATTDEDSATTGAVLANDSDADGDTLTVAAVNGQVGDVGTQITLGSGALLTLNSNGTFDYDPNGAFEGLAVSETGTDSFTYTVSDGNGGTDTGTVTINIDGVNDAPAARPDTFSTDEETPLAGLDLFANNGGGADSDPDISDVPGVTEVNGEAADVGNQITLASGALLTVDADGTADYDPNGVFNGLSAGVTAIDSFTYQLSDGNGGTDTATATVIVTGVNDDPDAVNDGLNVAVDATLSGNVLNDNGNGADSDPDTGDSLSVTALDGSTAALGTATSLASGAVVTLNANGTFDYDQNGTFSGLGAGDTATDSFDYTISDGNGGTDTATVTITIGGSNLPPVGVDDDFATDEDTAFTTDNVLTNDTDANSDTLSVTGLDTTGTVGLVTDNGDGTFDYDPNGQFEGLDDGESAADTFSYTVSDGNGGTDTATVTVTVDGVNDAPTVTPLVVTASEDDAPLNIDLLAGTNDVDGDALSVQNASASSSDGRALTGILSISGTSASVTPDGFNDLAAGESQDITIAYDVFDGTVSVANSATITISGVNDDPTAEDDSLSTDEDTAITGASVFADNGNGEDSDPDASDTRTVTAVNGSVGNVGTQFALASGALVTLLSDGTLDYDPNGQFETLAMGQSASDSFTYTIKDGNGGSDTATVTVTIDGVNDAPVAGSDSLTVDEDTAGSVIVTSNDTDVDDGDDLVILSVDTTGVAGNVTVGVDNETISYDPGGQFEFLAAGTSATETFTYTVSDGNGGTDTADVTVTIDGVNDPVIAVDDSGAGFVTDENTPFVTDNVLDNDTDVDGDTLSVTGLDTTGTQGLVTDNGDGTFSYDPNGAFDGLEAGDEAVDSFVYTVSDGNGSTDTATVSITIDGVSDGTGPNVVQGTTASDNLIGTDEDDMILSEGGPFDFLTGGLGADTFVFNATTGNGNETAYITDFTPGEDLIDLGGSTIASSFGFGTTTYLYLDLIEFDTVIVQGAASVDDISFV